jgi:hypothetical protein
MLHERPSAAPWRRPTALLRDLDQFAKIFIAHFRNTVYSETRTGCLAKKSRGGD